MRPELRFAIGVLAAATAVGTLVVIQRQGKQPVALAVGASAPYQMAIDADPAAAGIQPTLSVNGNASFIVGINVTRVGTTRYLAYQNEFAFPTAGLRMIGTVTENPATGFDAGCQPYAVQPGAPTPAQTLVGGGGGCIGAHGEDTFYIGQVSTFTLQCVTDGTFAVPLLDVSNDPFGTELTDAAANVLDTGTTGITVTCSNVLTATPTNTPAPFTPTATPTACGGACPTPTFTPQPAPNIMALDAAPGLPGVQANATVFGGAAFTVDIDVTSLGSTPYKGYEWEFEYETDGLAFADNIQEHKLETGLKNCFAPGPYAIPADPGFSTVGDGAGCDSLGGDQGTSYTGPITTFSLQCLHDGTFSVVLFDVQREPEFGSTLFDFQGTIIPTETRSMTITCQVTPTSTPTATPTGTPTAIAVPVRVGGIADVHIRPGTPAGATVSGDGEGAIDYVAAPAAVSATVLAMAVGGWYARRRRLR